MELLIDHGIDIKIDGWLEALFLHPFATVATESDLVSTDTSEVLDDFGTDQVSLARVGKQADGLDIGSCEASLGHVVLHIFINTNYY